MGSYIVSARKYRPDNFQSVVGQTHVTHTLRSAILMDQLAHAFLFSGPRGVGKTTCARILAKAINCENLTAEGEPCNQCTSCLTYNNGKSINIHELDAASNNSVDDIRNLIEQTRYVPANGNRSVYIIDEVHMLSQAAFNAFLKTLEEPPAHVLFILATTEKHKILPTILSRCQKFDFRRIKVEDIAKHLEHISQSEGIDYEYAALQQIALKADGALRDALSLYDQLTSYTQQKLTFASVLENLNILDYDYYFEAVTQVQAQNHTALLLLLNEIIEQGFEAKAFMIGLTEHIRNLLMCKQSQTVELLETSENVKKKYLQQSQSLSNTFLLNAFHLCSETESNLKFAAHPRLQVELGLIKLAHLEQAVAVAAGAAPEKKKPLTQPKSVVSAPTSEAPSVSVPAESQSGEKPVVENQETHPEHTAPSVPEKAPVVVANGADKKPQGTVGQRKAEFSLGQDLMAIKRQIKEQEALAPTEEATEEEPIQYELNPSIQLDEAVFRATLEEYIQKEREQTHMNLASALQEAEHTLVHNCWTCSVGNELQRGLIEKSRTYLLPYMRKPLSPELFLDLKVDEKLEAQRPHVPYTNEEKLSVMVEKNPSLQRLREIFGVRIIY